MKKEAGRFIGKLRPGLHMVNPMINTVEMVDLRAQTMSLPHQNVLSKDSVAFEIDTIINYKVVNADVACFNVTHYEVLVQNIAEAALKAVISQNRFSSVLDHRERINKAIMEFML